VLRVRVAVRVAAAVVVQAVADAAVELPEAFLKPEEESERFLLRQLSRYRMDSSPRGRQSH
jgi:hypothetical protein